MSFGEMTFYGSIMILIIAFIRVLTIHKLPKRMFVLLWVFTWIRLLIPFSVHSPFSIYTAMGQNEAVKQWISEAEINEDFSENITENTLQNVTADTEGDIPVDVTLDVASFHSYNIWEVIWIVGMFLCALFFVISYIRCYVEFRASLPILNDTIQGMQKKYFLRRRICFRQSDRISAPLTYGVRRPVILLPKEMDWNNTEQLKYVIMHEYIHIKRFDAVLKIFAIVVLTVHWFNPVVWLMYVLFQRDIELSCDEAVLRSFGTEEKADYARTLISWEEKRNLYPLGNHFSKNAIEERILAIMKSKKITGFTVAVSIVLVGMIVLLFATSGIAERVSGELEIGIVAETVDVPETVLETAKAIVREKYSLVNSSNFYNWRIEALSQVYTYEDLEEQDLLVYCLNYEFLVKDVKKEVLAGGASVDEEGWMTPQYPDSNYLIFRQEGEKLVFLAHMFENDCAPGSEMFTDDLLFCLVAKNSEEAEKLSGEMLVYIEDFNATSLIFDIIEWVPFPGERATELGITEDDAPNGFRIFNEKCDWMELSVDKKCVYQILQWEKDVTHREVSSEVFASIIEKQGQYPPPYHIVIENNRIVSIVEQYVP